MPGNYLSGQMTGQKLLSMKTKIIISLVAIAIILLVVFQLDNSKKQTMRTSAAPPIEVTPIEVMTSDVMDSPDGSKTLSVEKKGKFQTISVQSKTDGLKTEIYKEETVGPDKLEIPFNSWSPDNVYFFLMDKGPTVNNYFVFQSSGGLFSNNLPYVSMSELFNKNTPDYLIEEVTGWGGINLIIINAKNIIDSRKVSFWFDVPSQSFIQLGTYFK